MKIKKPILMCLFLLAALSGGMVINPIMPEAVLYGDEAGATLSPPVRGASDAPITIVEFADFLCPFCTKAYATLQKIMEDYPGKIKWVFRHFPLSLDPDRGSLVIHHAAACAQEQGRFWEFHDKLFSAPGRADRASLKKIALDLSFDMAMFEDCFETGKYHAHLLRERQAGSSQGVSSTPTFFINEHFIRGILPYEYFEQVVNALLEPDRYDLPRDLKQTRDGSEKIQFNDLKGRPSWGPDNAPITLVEFSDYHCPFCRQLTPTLNQLMEEFEGKIKRVFRHFPLDMHPAASLIHEAAACAHDQNQFWLYHRKLMNSPKIIRTKEELLNLAHDEKIAPAAFEKCLESGKFQDLIQEDIQAGIAAGVEGTPAVFINGQLLAGAQPYAVFKEAIQQELKKF